VLAFVFALFAPVLAGGAPHAAKNVDAAANKIDSVIFFITILLRHYSISKAEFNLQVQQPKSERRKFRLRATVCCLMLLLFSFTPWL
jgi:hypothetical protein